MATTYNETRYNLSQVPVLKDGKQEVDSKTNEPQFESLENITEKKKDDVLAQVKAAGLTEPQVTKLQTFQYTEVTGSSIDEILADFKAVVSQYQTDATKAVKVAGDIINRGVVLAQQKSIREFMLDADQGAQEGVFDVMPDAMTPGEGRRAADPKSAAAKALSKLVGRPVSLDEVDQLLSLFGGSAPAAPAEALQA